MPIRQYLEDQSSAFDPDAIKVMSDALERACRALNVNGHRRNREVIAARIIDLAQNGITDAKALSDRVVAERMALDSL
jgi:hypothetical protein